MALSASAATTTGRRTRTAMRSKVAAYAAPSETPQASSFTTDDVQVVLQTTAQGSPARQLQEDVFRNSKHGRGRSGGIVVFGRGRGAAFSWSAASSSLPSTGGDNFFSCSSSVAAATVVHDENFQRRRNRRRPPVAFGRLLPLGTTTTAAFDQHQNHHYQQQQLRALSSTTTTTDDSSSSGTFSKYLPQSLSKEAATAPPDAPLRSRWLAVPPANAVHLSIGSVYVYSSKSFSFGTTIT